MRTIKNPYCSVLIVCFIRLKGCFMEFKIAVGGYGCADFRCELRIFRIMRVVLTVRTKKYSTWYKKKKDD